MTGERGPAETFPLTAYQRDVWVAQASAPGAPLFSIGGYQRIEGPLDPAAFVDAARSTFAARDALRLRFAARDGGPVAWLAEAPPTVDVLDLSEEPAPEAAAVLWIERRFRAALPADGGLVDAAVVLAGKDLTFFYCKVHHLVADGWGLAELVRRGVFAAYEARLAGRPASGPAPTYRAFVERERAYARSPAWARDRAFLERELAGFEPALFARRPLASGSVRRSATFGTVLPRATLDRMRAFAGSPFPVVAAALAVSLVRTHGAAEIAIGVPLLNRIARDDKATVGHFANVLPLRLAVDEDRSFRALVAGVQAKTRATVRRQRVALGDVLPRLPPGADGNRCPFDVHLSYTRHPHAYRIGPLRVTAHAISHEHAQSAATLHLREYDEGGDAALDLEYAPDVFDADFPVAHFVGRLTALIDAGLDAPDAPLATLAILGTSERAAVVETCNATRAPFDDKATLHALFAARAAAHPDRVALEATATGPAWTYAELDRAADALAARIAASGVGPGDRVAVMLDRRPELLAALFGVLKAGGAYVPIDPGYPSDRIRLLLEDCRAKVLVTAGALDRGARAGVARTIDLDWCARADQEEDPRSGPRATAGDLAYVIYTSGSSGRPKGAMIEHRSVVNRLAWMQKAYPLGAGDVLLQKTPTSFDVSVWELFWWALAGARLALLPPGAEKDPRAVAAAIAAHGVTAIHFVPSMLAPFLDLLASSPDVLRSVASLRWVFASGEALLPATVNRFNQVFRAARTDDAGPRLVNLYGPTEATVDVSSFNCPTDPTIPVRRVPIGRPIDNTRLYVVDTRGRPQPRGVPGELLIAGVGVARGYLDRPDLTRERFVPDPFVPGARAYRSGDLARRLADGTLEYLGRMDGQVKIRGNRVELGEVQGALAEAIGVRQAVVVDRDEDGRGRQLVAYYVADAELAPAALRAHLAARLPDFMLPSFFVRVAAIPLTPNGKLDRRALPAPAAAARPAGRIAPRNALEHALAEVWSEVLGCGEIGVDDDFHDLGGDSILILSVCAAAAGRGLAVATEDVLQCPTIARLAERVAAAAPAHAREPARPLAPFELVAAIDRAGLAGAADAFPASRLQLGMLYHALDRGGDATYRDVFRYSLRVAWDEAALRAAFAEVLARHPALRSTFDLGGRSEPLQIVHANLPGGLTVVDHGDCEAADVERALAAHAAERRVHPYDLARGPLVHLRVDRAGAAVHLTLSFHHAVLDGWSVAVVVRDLLTRYLARLEPRASAPHAGELAGAAPEAPAAGTTQAAAVAAERRALGSPESRAYWTEMLRGAEPTRIAPLRLHATAAPAGHLVHDLAVSAELEAATRAFARAHAVPLKSVLLAAHVLALGLLTQADDVTTGAVAHVRPELPDAAATAGLFLNTLPLRLRVRGLTGIAAVRAVVAEERAAAPHRAYPLAQLQAELGAAAELETAFNFVSFHVLGPVLREAGLEVLDVAIWEETHFALLVNAIVDPRDGHLRLRFDADGRRATASQVELHAAAYAAVLARIVDAPESVVDAAILAPSIAPVTAAPGAPDVLAAFDAHASRTAGATAVTCGDRHFTYAELAAASRAVAARLRDEGVGCGSRVGIAVDRSFALVASVLGVLRAGAACVPMDPTYPAARIAAIVAAARPIRVLADERHAARLGGARAVVMESIDLRADVPTAGADADAPDAVAYVLFTSGSTGTPKGVAMPRRALANLVAWQTRAASGAAASTLQFAPLGFDVAFQEILSTLAGGGRLVLVSDEERLDAPRLLALLERERVERAILPFVALQQLAEVACALGRFPTALRVLASSGEELRITEEVRRLCAALPGCLLENQYGPTETHVVTHFTLRGAPAAWPPLPPVGRPLPGVAVRVLDGALRPVPVGAPGEVYLGGVCLADGYEGQPERTRERFVDVEVGGQVERLYRTGDLGRLLPTGDLVFGGRADGQVKVRGHRVELAEVELALLALLAASGAGAEAAVVARQRDGVTTLAAFVVGRGDDSALESLREGLRARLPAYMVPHHFAWIDALPRVPSGKRDDAALRALPLGRGAPRPGITAPRDETERRLLELARDRLGYPELGAHDDLFDAGMTSLDAVRLVVSVQTAFGVALPLADLARARTVVDLAARLRGAGARARAFDPLVPIRAEGRRLPVFLVHPIGGSVLCYARLAAHLSADQPVFGLQAPGTEAGDVPLDRVEALAARHLEAVRRAQPEGPYHLGGWSFGGYVAFEMAQQLLAAGERVQSLVLLDSIACEPHASPRVERATLVEWFARELVWGAAGGRATTTVRVPRGASAEAELEAAFEIAAAAGAIPGGTSRELVRRLFRVFEASWRALLAYRPRRIAIPLTLLRARAPLPAALAEAHRLAGSQHADGALGWGAYAAQPIDVIDVPGDHLDMMEPPNLAVVARELERVLEDRRSLRRLPVGGPDSTRLRRVG